MNIVVCIKQVPDAKTVRFDTEKGTLVREGVEAVINPFDFHALEAGLQMRDTYGGKVTVLTMGPLQAENALREAVSLGADKGILLSDRAFAGADTLATTYTLAMAIKKLGPVDLVLCGKQAIDGDTAQVGPGLAVRLGLPHVTCVNALSVLDDGKTLHIRRINEDGYDILELEMPALLTVLASLNTPRLPSLKGKMRAGKADIPVWDARELGAEPGRIGLAGSATRVISTSVPTFKARREILEGSAEEQVEALVFRFKEAGFLNA
ncbi:MAG: electron transfer flavoprotein subunit beta/FixA family protein [Deltaproteobacteria bacterium]|mgnify:CR=1 FL=1|nr:electron transfer flavoprotein subunit beta/FixA family protein [Deltaproteobacteria bacterium]MBW1946336.1 electron transfer flavoprotein subunit beta/FixA family protein [Deltaproteobacteria bacterium]MBW1966735.1 electron transfer flavoprotein subunit beta/FixA family protein [Deltaproteobacteria bacterium]MBW2098396.1 electron transfer flavoprotein subunit beta/FixA family protein [Deltaproteobacteria bacterium]